MLFAKYWGIFDRSRLREQYLEILSGEQLYSSSANEYVAAYKTGFIFPAHKQVRPIPFNDELKNTVSITDQFGMFSRMYSQRAETFTPGVLTFCCSCSHPNVMGF